MKIKAFSQLSDDLQIEIAARNNAGLEKSGLPSEIIGMIRTASMLLHIAPLDALFGMTDAMTGGLPGVVTVEIDGKETAIFGDEGKKYALFEKDYKKALKFFSTLIQLDVIQPKDNRENARGKQ